MAATTSRKFSGKKCLELFNWYESVQDKFIFPLAVLINDDHC